MDPTRSNSRPNAQPEDLNCSTSDNKEGTTGTTMLRLPENDALDATWRQNRSEQIPRVVFLVFSSKSKYKESHSFPPQSHLNSLLLL